MNQLVRLFGERLDDGRVRMAEAANGNARAKVEIALARDIKNVTACAMAKGEVKTAIARHDIFAEQFANRLKLILDDGR